MRFIMIGGLLGAGKTTTMARLARYYMERGQRVGLVTNDQAQDRRYEQFAGRRAFRRGGALLLLPLR